MFVLVNKKIHSWTQFEHWACFITIQMKIHIKSDSEFRKCLLVPQFWLLKDRPALAAVWLFSNQQISECDYTLTG